MKIITPTKNMVSISQILKDRGVVSKRQKATGDIARAVAARFQVVESQAVHNVGFAYYLLNEKQEVVGKMYQAGSDPTFTKGRSHRYLWVRELIEPIVLEEFNKADKKYFEQEQK